MLDYIFRDARIEDVEAMAKLRADAWFETYPNVNFGITEEDIKKEPLYTAEVLEQRRKDLREGQMRMWVVENPENKEVIAYTSAGVKDGKCVLAGMYVKRSHQGQGLGKELTKRVLEWFGNAKDVYLEVVTYNRPAIRLYEKFGFQKSNVVLKRPEVVFLTGKKMPLVTMIRPAS